MGGGAVNAVPEQLASASSSATERETLATQLRTRLAASLTQPAGDAEDGLPMEQGSRLARLAQVFGLSPFESDVVAVLWVGAFDPKLRAAMCAFDRGGLHPTPRGIAQWLRHTPRVRLASESPLRTWRLVDEHPMVDGNAALALDPHIIAWLEGESELDRALCDSARIVISRVELPAWPLDRWAAELVEGVRRGSGFRVQLAGDDPTLAQDCAAALARRLGMPLLAVDENRGDDAVELRLRAHRQAFLDGCALFFAGGQGDAGVSMPFPLQFSASAPIRSRPDVRELTLQLPALDAPQRLRLWQTALPDCVTWAAGEVDALVAHEATAGEITRVALSSPPNVAAALTALREISRADLGGLAQRIDANFNWDDLVVPAAVSERLHEFAFEARGRDRFWSDPSVRRLYPQGRGLVALFAGPPGTGKTMAAQVIAAELGLDLWRVDLSAVLSKWVGETAQNLQKILGAGSARRAVLFFDEADALYGKRVEEVRDAQDRFANMDISHLMVALEAYDGIVVMATNLRGNIDGAFMRRIRHVVEFPRPDVQARRAIWQRVSAVVLGAEAPDDTGLDCLARLDSTGAQIKNAVLSGVFAARAAGVRPDKRFLGRMLARELAKDGAGISQRDLDDLVGAAP
jgi:hypothetical protein